MERTGTNARNLLKRVTAETGKTISPTMLSFILRGSRRCSLVNAAALSAVTGVPVKALTQWPKVSESAKSLGKGSHRAA